MTDLTIYLLEQMKKHPSLQPRDVVKLCYQAAFGAEHLLQDLAGAKAYLEKEFAEVTAAEGALYEPISDDICRVNLAVWKYCGLPVEWLFRMFAASPVLEGNGEEQFLHYLKQAETVLESTTVGISAGEFQGFLQEYLKEGIRPVHHSEIYRQQEQPAYRIINRRFSRLFPILQKAEEKQRTDRPCIIAIDGRAASGKTTLAKDLQKILEADTIRMDDFFLPMELRTAERFAQPGGNVLFERFAAEVLPFLSDPEPFSYGIFDCGRMDYHGRREIQKREFRIVEGSYSCHPVFGDYADITVFSDVEPKEQMDRILKRNGAEMAEMFCTRWIPLEEAYFQAYQIAEKTEIQLK